MWRARCTRYVEDCSLGGRARIGNGVDMRIGKHIVMYTHPANVVFERIFADAENHLQSRDVCEKKGRKASTFINRKENLEEELVGMTTQFPPHSLCHKTVIVSSKGLNSRLNAILQKSSVVFTAQIIDLVR